MPRTATPSASSSLPRSRRNLRHVEGVESFCYAVCPDTSDLWVAESLTERPYQTIGADGREGGKHLTIYSIFLTPFALHFDTFLSQLTLLQRFQLSSSFHTSTTPAVNKPWVPPAFHLRHQLLAGSPISLRLTDFRRGGTARRPPPLSLVAFRLVRAWRPTRPSLPVHSSALLCHRSFPPPPPRPARIFTPTSSAFLPSRLGLRVLPPRARSWFRHTPVSD